MSFLRIGVPIILVASIVVAGPAQAGESPEPVHGTSAATSAMQPIWQSVPQLVVPERSTLIRVLIDGEGNVHLFFVTNEGVSKPPPVSVVSWSGNAWSAPVRLGSAPDANDFDLRTPSSATAGIPTVGWAAYGTVYLARYQNGAWSGASADIPGVDSSASAWPFNFTFATVGTAANGTSVGLVRKLGSCPAAAGVLGCEWTVSWPNGSSTPTVADIRKRACCGSETFWVSNSGAIEALVTQGSGPTYQVIATSVQDGSWTEGTPISEFRGYSAGSFSVRVVNTGGRLVATWSQLDPEFGETLQVVASQRIEDTWRPTEVLATNAEFAGLVVASSDGPACARYIHRTTRESFARVLTGTTWGAPLSMDSPSSTSPTSSACLFVGSEVGDFEIGNALVGVTPAHVFSAPAVDPRAVTTSRGRAWSIQLQGGTVTARRLEFERSSVPSVPTNVVTRPLKGSIQVTWTAPTTPGAGPISYEFRVNAGKWTKTSKTQVSIKSPRGKRVAISVRAVNSTGAGPVAIVSATAK